MEIFDSYFENIIEKNVFWEEKRERKVELENRVMGHARQNFTRTRNYIERDTAI